MSKSPRFEIDYETSDRVTVMNLKDTFDFLKKKTSRLPADSEESIKNTVLIEQFKGVLQYYGEVIK